MSVTPFYLLSAIFFRVMQQSFFVLLDQLIVDAVHAQVLHGGDHFTLAWAAAGGAGDGETPPSAPSTTSSKFILYV